MKIAVIDIGSNSIRYMEAELTEQGFGFSDKSVFTTRLAQGLISSGILAEDRMQASIEVLRSLALRAQNAGLPCYCYATSAVRDAKNQSDFLTRVLTDTELQIKVLSGNEEALYARLGAGQAQGGLIDIGGGSSQVVTSEYHRSFPLGCVRVRDLCGGKPLSAMQDLLEPIFASVYASLPPFPRLGWTAVGGTATTLAALSLDMTHYDANKIKEASLAQQKLLDLLLRLDQMGDKRAEHPLLLKRHDVIRGGGLILLHLMQRIGIEQINFSDADGLEGFAIKLLKSTK